MISWWRKSSYPILSPRMSSYLRKLVTVNRPSTSSNTPRRKQELRCNLLSYLAGIGHPELDQTLNQLAFTHLIFCSLRAAKTVLEATGAQMLPATRDTGQLPNSIWRQPRQTRINFSTVFIPDPTCVLSASCYLMCRFKSNVLSQQIAVVALVRLQQKCEGKFDSRCQSMTFACLWMIAIFMKNNSFILKILQFTSTNKIIVHILQECVDYIVEQRLLETIEVMVQYSVLLRVQISSMKPIFWKI